MDLSIGRARGAARVSAPRVDRTRWCVVRARAPSSGPIGDQETSVCRGAPPSGTRRTANVRPSSPEVRTRCAGPPSRRRSADCLRSSSAVVDAGAGPERVASAGAAGASVGGRLPPVAWALHARSRQAALHRGADGRYKRTGPVRDQATQCHVANVAVSSTSRSPSGTSRKAAVDARFMA